MQPLTHYRASITFLLLVLLSLIACNLPRATYPVAAPAHSATRAPLNEAILPVTAIPSPTVQLVTWRGGPTRTPFQPQTPTPTSTAAPSNPPAATATVAAAPTVTPNLATWAPPDANGPTPSTPVPDPYPNYSGPETINFLLIGSDRRTSSFRTDTLIIASLQPNKRLVTLISVPRDLYVYIPGWTMNRVNTAYMRGEMSGHPGGGPGLLKDTILYNLGVRIDHLAMVEFEGFEEIVDTLGGIDVPLACPFTDWHIKNPRRSDQDPNNWELYTIGPGMVHMDGDLALWYARSRLRSSDFDRGRRQQEVLRAIYTRGMQLNVIPHLPKLYKQMREAVTADLSLDDLLELAPVATNLGGEHRIRSFYINKDVLTAWRTPSGAAVQLPKRAALEELIASAMSPPEKEERRELKLVVEVRNATTNSDWDLLAAQRLHYAGYETRVVPVDQDDHDRTWLYDFTTEQDPDQSTALRRALGLPASSLISEPQSDSSVHYRLVLGEDYNPCFNPASAVISDQ